MAKRTLTVTIDGQVFRRTTAHEYTHVVAGRAADGSIGVWTWCHSEANALRALRTDQKNENSAAAWEDGRTPARLFVHPVDPR